MPPPFPPSIPPDPDPDAQISPDPAGDLGILQSFTLDDIGAPEDWRSWSTDADLPGVTAAAAAPPVAVGAGGHAAAPCGATAGTTTQIQHLEEGDAQQSDSWSEAELQRLIEEVGLSTAPDEKLVVVETPALEEGSGHIGHPSCRDADMTEINAAAPQPGPRGGGGGVCATSKHVEEEDPFSSFNSAVEQDLLGQGHTPTGCDRKALSVALSELKRLMLELQKLEGEKLKRRREELEREELESWMEELKRRREELEREELKRRREELEREELKRRREERMMVLSFVLFTGPDSKGRKPHQAGWKERSMKGLRAVADPSSPQPPAPGQQQRYVGLKKTLERDDDNGNKWRAHEYTPLVPADDGSDKLVPAEISLRVEFKQDEPPPPPAASSSMKRKEDEAPLAEVAFTKRPKIAPKKSPVWEHMTRIHVKVAPATNKDGTQRRKNPYYKVMFAICHHCDQVFNADSSNGTHNLSNHLDCCNDCKCTHSHSH